MNTRNITVLLIGIIIFIVGFKMRMEALRLLMPLVGITLIAVSTAYAIRTLKK